LRSIYRNGSPLKPSISIGIIHAPPLHKVSGKES
jgi:hypothetical protein